MAPLELKPHHVPFGRKIAFGFGMLANQMFPAALGVFLVVLVQNLGFSPLLWGFIFFAPRAFDAVTDPIMGFISDNTRSKWGRRRQYILIGAIILGLSYVAMWQLYAENGIQFNFVYFLGMSLIFYLGLTIFSVPFVAMGYEMSDDFHERTSIMAVAQFIGQWAWVIAPWFWVILYDQNWFSDPASGVRQLSIWVGVSCAFLAMIPALFIRDDLGSHGLQTHQCWSHRLERRRDCHCHGSGDRDSAVPEDRVCDLPRFQFFQRHRHIHVLHHLAPPVQFR